MLIVSHKEIFLGNPRARQRPKRPAAAGSRRDGTREGRDPISTSRRGGGRPK